MYKSLRVGVPCVLASGYAVQTQTPTQTTRKHQNRKVISSFQPVLQTVLTLPASASRPRSEDTGETVALVSRAGVSAVLCSSACLLAFTHTPRSFSLALSLHLSRACAHTTHCRRVSLALRISSECTVEVCAEINAAAPPDQQRFPVSCEVTGLRSELRYRLRPKLRCLPCSFWPRSGGWSRKSQQ